MCLGEGEGRNAIWLAQLGFQVTAVDLSSVGLRHTAERATKLGVEVTTIQADLGVWEIERHAWDLIVSIFCHLPPDVRSFVHQKVVQGLNANGLFVLEAYAPSQITRGTGGPSDVKLLASARQLAGELQGLEFVHLNETSRPVVEGHRHTGLADVVQVVAQKRA